MARKRPQHANCTVLRCDKEEKSPFSLPSNEPEKTQWLTFIYAGNVPSLIPKFVYVCAKHFSEECFHNLGQYISGFAATLRLRSGSVPSLAAPPSATHIGQVKTEEDADSVPAPQLCIARTNSVACQAERAVVSVGTQLSKTTLAAKFRSKASQTPAVKIISFGTDTDVLLPADENEQTRPKQLKNASFLKSDNIGLFEEVAVQVSCLLQLFDRCLGCRGELCSLLMRRVGKAFYVTQQCWTCHVSKEWTSHSKLPQQAPGDENEKTNAAVQSGEDINTDLEELEQETQEDEEEESDQDMEEEEEEEEEEEDKKTAGGTKRKRRDSDDEWTPDMQDFVREFVGGSSDDSEESSCEEDEDGDGECASECLVWCCECGGETSSSCLGHRHPQLYCCVRCGYTEEPRVDGDCKAAGGVESTCHSEELLERRPPREASCTSTPEGETEHASGQQVDRSLQRATTGHPEETTRGSEGPAYGGKQVNGNQDSSDHNQPINGNSEGLHSTTDLSGAITDGPRRISNQSGASSEGPPGISNHSAANSEAPHGVSRKVASGYGEQQDGDKGSEVESSHSRPPPFAVYFSDPSTLQTHMEQEHYIHTKRKLCPDCGKFFSKHNAMMAHDCEHKVKPFVCATCEKRFATEVGLHNHQYVHQEEYVVYCQFCFKSFRQREEKLEHEESHRGEALKFYCRECPKRFADRHSRSAHRKTHWNHDRFFCEHCDKGFKKSHQLRRHKMIHTGKKPYTCEVCDRSFNQPGHLKSHMRLHTGERPFKCHQCERSFNHNVSLKNHLQRYHKPKTGSPEDDQDVSK